MLYFDSALELQGLTIFRDYNSPSRFYYMPRAPHLTVEGGAPMFQLLIYRRDITDNPDFHEGDRPGGGFLTMTIDLGVPPATLAAVKAELAGRVGGDVDLVAVPFEGGEVRISALGLSVGTAAALEGGDPAAAAAPAAGEAARGPRFIENIMGSAKPSLYGDNRVVFSMELSHEGAELMRASPQANGATQIAAIYNLDYRGLMPAYEVKITIDFHQSYSYLRSRFQANTLWFKADIDAEVEQLRKDGHIKIEEADYLQSDPAKLAERAQQLNQLAKELATWSFFHPGLTPGKVVAEDRGTISVYDPTADAKKLEAGFTAPLMAAGTGRGSPGDTTGPRVPGASGSAATTRVGGDATPPPAAADTAPATETSGQGSPTAVEAWNKMGRPQSAFLLRSLTQEEQQTITYDLRQVSASKRSAAPQGSIRMMPGASQLPGRIKEVDLNDPFFERLSGTVTTSADLAAAGVTSMVVKLRYGVRDDGSSPKDTAEIALHATGDKGTYSFFMDRSRSVTLDYQVVVTYKAGFAIGSNDTTGTSDWIPTTTRNLDIDPRAVGAVFPVSLVLGNVDWHNVQSVQSTVLYDSGGQHSERTVVLTQATPAAVVPIRPPAGGTRAFHVRSIFFYGSVQEVVDLQGEDTATVVINPPTTRAIPVSITATDPLGRFRKITVELSYVPPGQPEQTSMAELPGDGASAAWTFFRPDDLAASAYRYRVTLFGRDGTTQTSEWQTTTERQLIVGDRFEGLISVDVQFLVPDFTQAGFMGGGSASDTPRRRRR
jgi:hypothetical protein